MSVIKPGKDAHRVLAMGDNRTYGLDLAAGQTVQPQPFSLSATAQDPSSRSSPPLRRSRWAWASTPNSTFRRSSTARAWVTATPPDVRPRTWCVKNAGGDRGPMNVTDALAQSPNTAFAKLIQQVGVPRAVDMAVRLGLRSYAEPGTARAYDPNNNGSLADYVKQQNLGSFTLGPLELNALELSNVAATLASGGMWCPPNPIDKVFDRTWPRGAAPTARPANRWSPKDSPIRWPTRWARTHQRHGRGFGRFGRLEPADVGQDRHHRVPPVLGIPRLHQPVRRRQLHLRRHPRPRRICVRSRCGGARAATSTAATNPRAPGTWR